MFAMNFTPQNSGQRLAVNCRDWLKFAVDLSLCSELQIHGPWPWHGVPPFRFASALYAASSSLVWESQHSSRQRGRRDCQFFELSSKSQTSELRSKKSKYVNLLHELSWLILGCPRHLDNPRHVYLNLKWGSLSLKEQILGYLFSQFGAVGVTGGSLAKT